jgi:hypothetical protein
MFLKRDKTSRDTMHNNMDLKGKKMKSEKCLKGHLEMVAHIFS